MAAERSIRCGGSGELVERISPPGVDPRDPAFEAREVPCPGCPDCSPSQLSPEERYELESSAGYPPAFPREQR